MTKTRIALMGAGLIGREHAALISAHGSTELVAIVDVSDDGKAFAQSYGVPWFESYEAMLDETQPDGAVVALPNQLHLAAGLACLKRGVVPLIEKPIADTLEAGLALVKASEETDVPVLVGHHRRHSPDIREARRAVEARELGDLVAVSGMWLVKKHDSYFDAEWRRKAGGGPLLINFIHDIDCLRYLCGEVISVQALGSNSARGFDVEDTAGIVMRFENGAIGTFICSDVVPSPYTWDVSSGQALYFPTHRENCYYLGGRQGTLAVPTMNLWQHEPGGDWRNPLVCRQLQPAHTNTYVNQLEHFVEVIHRKVAPVVSARDGLLTLAVTSAVDLAIREGRTVNPADLLSVN